MKYLVTFAGPIGSSKSPIAHYLSLKFHLPISSNDVIRTEVIEDMGTLIETEFRSRAKDRFLSLLNSGKIFIFDASVDRRWQNIEAEIYEKGYRVFLVSLDISYQFLEKIHLCKNYQESTDHLKNNFQEHQKFLKKYSQLVSLSINDHNFSNRLLLSQQALDSWLKS